MSQPALRGGLDDAVYAILDAAASAVVCVDGDGIIDYCNPSAVDSIGYTVAELVGAPIEVLVPADSPGGHLGERIERVRQPGARGLWLDPQLEVRRKDGSHFPAEVALTPVEAPAGRWVVVSVHDISLRQRTEARMRELSRAYLTLARLNQAVVRAPDEISLFEETCRIAVEHGGYLGAWVGRPDEDGRVLALARAGELDTYIERLYLDPESVDVGRPCAVVMREGTVYYGSDLQDGEETPPWHRLGAEYDIRSQAALPLRCGGRTVAVLSLYSGHPWTFDSEMRALLEGVVENVSFALDGFEAVKQLNHVSSQRRELSHRLVAAQEEERNRIAADVHDDSIQSLAAVDLRLGLLSRKMAEASPQLLPDLDQVQETVGTVIGGLRDLLFELEPADTATVLPHLLLEAAEHAFEDTGVRPTVGVDAAGWDGTSTLSPTDRGQALRIVKEALSNSRQHGQAETVRIELLPDAEGVEISVSDDGAGFDPDQVKGQRGHRGLTSMCDRAEASGGWLRIEHPAVGTTVRFWMPYDETAPPYMAPSH